MRICLIFVLSFFLENANAGFERMGFVDPSLPLSYASSISEDGNVVAGASAVPQARGGMICIRWENKSGLTQVKGHFSNSGSSCEAISPGGEILGGYVNRGQKAAVFQFSRERSSVIPKTRDMMFTYSTFGLSANADNGVGIGFFRNWLGDVMALGYLWDNPYGNPKYTALSNPESIQLESLWGVDSNGRTRALDEHVTAVSDDGKVILGFSYDQTFNYNAVVWGYDRRVKQLQLPGRHFFYSVGNALSADGKTAAGFSISAEGAWNTYSTIWDTESLSVKQVLDHPSDWLSSGITAITPGAEAYGGTYLAGGGSVRSTFVYSEKVGFLDLKELLLGLGNAELQQWTLDSIQDITLTKCSLVVVGWGRNEERFVEGFRAEVPRSVLGLSSGHCDETLSSMKENRRGTQLNMEKNYSFVSALGEVDAHLFVGNKPKSIDQFGVRLYPAQGVNQKIQK